MTAVSASPAVRPNCLWSVLIGVGIAWGLALVLIAAVMEPTPENLALSAAIWSAGAYTVALRITRRWWIRHLTGEPLVAAVLLGIFNASVIETEFLIFEKVFGAEGVAAHPNLAVDLLLTMPWYIPMCLTFVRVQNRRRFTAPTVLFLSGIYELGGDGIVGSLMGIFFGNFQLFTPAYWIQLALMFFWAFIPVYSSMVLPPSWVVAASPPPAVGPSMPGWLDALKPMLWLIPFTVYLVIAMVVLSMVQSL